MSISKEDNELLEYYNAPNEETCKALIKEYDREHKTTWSNTDFILNKLLNKFISDVKSPLVNDYRRTDVIEIYDINENGDITLYLNGNFYTNII